MAVALATVVAPTFLRLNFITVFLSNSTLGPFAEVTFGNISPLLGERKKNFYFGWAEAVGVMGLGASCTCA